jgi:hypothetical protein
MIILLPADDDDVKMKQQHWAERSCSNDAESPFPS